MEESEFLRRMREDPSILRVERMPDDLYARIVAEESTVTGAGGQMPVHNVGLEDCDRRTARYVVFMLPGALAGADPDPDYHTMVMRDSVGSVVGFDISPRRVDEFRARDDVVFLSDDFVLFPSVCPKGELCMEIRAMPYAGRGGWIPEETGPIVWFPCSTSTVILAEYYGMDLGQASAAMLALDI